MFGRKKKTETSPQDAQGTENSVNSEKASAPKRGITESKGRPTPSRKQQEAARHQPLVPKDRKAAKQMDRQARREQRLHVQQRMASGDERFLPQRDRGAQRAFIRDWVDARFSMFELVLPMALVALLFVMIPSGLQELVMTAFYALLLVVLLDTVIMVIRLKRVMRRKFGELQPGTGFYAVTRCIGWRSTRMPRPRVKRGERIS